MRQSSICRHLQEGLIREYRWMRREELSHKCAAACSWPVPLKMSHHRRAAAVRSEAAAAVVQSERTERVDWRRSRLRRLKRRAALACRFRVRPGAVLQLIRQRPSTTEEPPFATTRAWPTRQLGRSVPVAASPAARRGEAARRCRSTSPMGVRRHRGDRSAETAWPPFEAWQRWMPAAAAFETSQSTPTFRVRIHTLGPERRDSQHCL
jgi:hypothetical protein